MTHYWRLKDIPELRDVPPGDRRKWWREAVVQSRDTRDAIIRFFAFLCTMFAADMLARQLGYGNGWVLAACKAVAVGLVVVVTEYGLNQPRARRWLQANLARQMAREQRLASN